MTLPRYTFHLSMSGAEITIEHCFENSELACREARMIARAIVHNDISGEQKYFELTDETGGVIYREKLS